MAMKVKTSTAARAKSRLVGIFLAIVVIVVVSFMIMLSAQETRKTISVVRLKSSVSANAIITEDMLDEYKMYYKEFEQYGITKLSDGTKKQAIVTWDDRDKVIGNRYAAYYMREQTVLFWDATMKEQTKKNSYLYSMDGELLNIKMDTKDFGDMVVPGDTLNIRVAYNETLYDLPDEEAYMLSVEADGRGSSEPLTVGKREMLFSEVQVLDMLNSDGNSIFDIYYDYISKSKAKQQELLKDKEFLKSIEPDTILLEVTAEEADRFMKISAYSPKYLMTLLPRTGSNSIIDSLADIQAALAGKSS